MIAVWLERRHFVVAPLRDSAEMVETGVLEAVRAQRAPFREPPRSGAIILDQVRPRGRRSALGVSKQIGNIAKNHFFPTRSSSLLGGCSFSNDLRREYYIFDRPKHRFPIVISIPADFQLSPVSAIAIRNLRAPLI